MTIKYCPHCKRLGDARVMAHYEQVPWKGIEVKQRRVVHMVEDGGCGLTWYTAELPFDLLPINDQSDDTDDVESEEEGEENE